MSHCAGTERLSLQYAIKLSSTPNNPTFDTVFRPKYSEIFAQQTKCYTNFWITNQRPCWWGKYKYWNYLSSNCTRISTLATRFPNNYIWSELGCGSLSNRDRRREQLVLWRLRLGHTYITHRYLLAGDDPPVCISCQENLTVEHTLIHCAEYFHVRIQCFDVDNLRDLLTPFL